MECWDVDRLWTFLCAFSVTAADRCQTLSAGNGADGSGSNGKGGVHNRASVVSVCAKDRPGKGGEYFLLRVAIAILQLQESALLGLKFESIVLALKRMRLDLDPQMLLDMAAKVRLNTLELDAKATMAAKRVAAGKTVI